MTKQNVNIDYANSFSEKLLIFKRTLKSYGIKSVIQKIIKRFVFIIKGIDFSGEHIGDLKVIGNNKKDGVTYVGTSFENLESLIDVIKRIDSSILKGSFVDYGSGKGSVLVFAYKLGFQKIVGIEFVTSFYKTSLLNIKKILKSPKNIQIINDDAINYIPEKYTKVIFFYNPFNEKNL
jgi:hypothetical protein